MFINTDILEFLIIRNTVQSDLKPSKDITRKKKNEFSFAHAYNVAIFFISITLKSKLKWIH